MTVGAQVKQCLASVKSIESTLSSFALRHEDEDAKRILLESKVMAESVSSDLKKRVGELEQEEMQYKGF